MYSTLFRRVVLGTLASLLVVFTSSAFAQNPSLAELARKEQERRKQQKGAPKVLTNKDLPPSALNPSAPASQPAAQSGEPVGQKPTDPKATDPKATPDKDECGEECWRSKMADLREQLRQNGMFAEALQSRVDALRRDFTARDNPVQRARVAEDRENALAELNRVKGEIEKAKKQIADLEEEARKAGVPPGWLR
jgi:hypothetical protein